MNVPLRLTLKVWSHSSKEVSSLAEFMLMPALLQAMWTAPHLDRMVSIILWTSSDLLMSAVMGTALIPGGEEEYLLHCKDLPFVLYKTNE